MHRVSRALSLKCQCGCGKILNAQKHDDAQYIFVTALPLDLEMQTFQSKNKYVNELTILSQPPGCLRNC